MKWTIRQEKPGDEDAIAQVTRRAFAGKAYADGDEDALPGKLRDAGALVLSLVAIRGKDIIGHIALSPAHIGETKCLGVGPVSVVPDLQGKGIGSALVNHAVAVAGAYGRGGVVLMGNPAFYGRLGFVAQDGPTYKGKPSIHLQIQGFEETPQGDVSFHPAFGD